MRKPVLALSALAFGVALVVGATTQATAAPSGPDPSTSSDMSGMNGMPGMTMPGTANTAPPQQPTRDRDKSIDRARQKPIFLAAKLDAKQEVPVAGKPPVGDPDGSANGIVRVQGDRITFALSWKGISAPTLGHLHQGAAGTNGDVKALLFAAPMPDTVTAAVGVLTVNDPAIADALRADPAGFYLNLHTKDFPGGAVRGQLGKLNRPADLFGLLGDAGFEKAFLSGDNEVPVADGPAVGDPSGRAVAFVKAHDNEVNYSFAWLGITPTLGHIHKAPFGANGPVVVPLFAQAVPATIIAVAGTASNADPAVVKDIRQHPGQFYANLHTAQFPGGAVRGQLFNRR